MTINPNHEEEITSTLLKSSPPIDDSSEKPKSPFIKWFGLFLICFYVFGKSWAYDNPQALQNSLIDNMNINSEQYNWFYTIYSIPNYVLPLFSGYLVDRFGLKFGIFFFGFVVVIGQALFWLGCVLSSYGVALTGRLLFGIGGETSLLVRYCMLAQWFSNEDFGFASGATFLIQRLASTFNSLLTPKIYQSTQSLGWATFVALILCFACWFFGVIYLILSKKYSKKAKIEQENTRTEPIKKPELKQILGFHKFSYLFCTLAVIYLSVFISFTANGNSFLQKHYGFSQSQAGNVLSPLYVVAGVFTLIFGKVVDIIGKKLHFVLLGFAFEVLSMFLFIILPECSQCYIGLIPLACVGLSSALFSSGYWPTVKLLEKKEHVGMLMGLITIAYNIGEGVFPAIVGAIEDKTVADEQGYFYVLVFLGISALVGFFVMILVEFLNFKQKRGLNEIVKVES